MKVVKMKTQHHKTLRIAAALALTGMLSVSAFASPVPSNNATADVTVRLIEPISIQKSFDLNFGTLVTGGTGIIALYPWGVLDAGSRAMPSLGDPKQQAVFIVSGEPDLSYSLSGGDPVQLGNGNGDFIEVTPFINISSTGGATSGILGASGFDAVSIGGYFELNNASRGTYTAPAGISLTVNYN